MAGESQSKYALKRTGKLDPGPSGTRMRRVCSKCGRILSGRRGHGFPTPLGGAIHCSRCVSL